MALYTDATPSNLIETNDYYTEIRYVGIILGGLIPAVTKQKRTVTRNSKRYFGIMLTSANAVAAGLAGGENVTVSIETTGPISADIIQATETYGEWVDTT